VCLNLYFFMWSGKKFITNKQKNLRLLLKKRKKKKDGKFYKLKNEKAKEKIIFVNSHQKGSLQNGQCQKGP